VNLLLRLNKVNLLPCSRSEERKWVRIGAWWRCTVLDFLLKGRRGGGEAVGLQVGFHGISFGNERSTRGGEVRWRDESERERRKSVAWPGDEETMKMKRNGKRRPRGYCAY
jgi:hypothetical protein